MVSDRTLTYFTCLFLVVRPFFGTKVKAMCKGQIFFKNLETEAKLRDPV